MTINRDDHPPADGIAVNNRPRHCGHRVVTLAIPIGASGMAPESQR